MALKLDQLRCFVAVAEERNISRAAERLGMQQPPLSQQMKALEAALQVQLLRRVSRGVELTEAGASLLADARAILGRVEQAGERARRMARGEEGRLVIGVAPTGPFHPFVPKVIRAFRERHPKVEVAMEEVLSNQALERLKSELIDVAFLRADVPNPDELAVHRLLDEPLVAALPAEHPLALSASARSLDLRELGGESFIVFGGKDGPGLVNATILACAKAGFTPRVVQEAPRITSTLGLVAAGLGVSLVPESICRVRMEGVAYYPVTGIQDVRAVLNLAHRRGDSSKVLRHFSQLVRKAAREADGDLSTT